VRVLVPGIGTFWGGRLAQVVERDPRVEVVVGLDSRSPAVPLERTEVVRADSSYSILSRLVRATEVDTILHTHLEVDSTTTGSRAMHETNVIGTMNLLAAAGAPGTSVRKMVVKSSTLVYGSGVRDPNTFREEMGRSRPGRTASSCTATISPDGATSANGSRPFPTAGFRPAGAPTSTSRRKKLTSAVMIPGRGRLVGFQRTRRGPASLRCSRARSGS